MFHWLKTACVAGVLYSLTFSAWAGVVVGGTRVVYEGAKKEASISVSNPEKTKPYLIQSWLDNAVETDTTKVPFIITPPLFRLDAGQENVLRIVYTDGALPEDRESVYWLNIKSIPASEKSEVNTLLISVKTQIKLFYRPAGLTGNADNAYKSLTFSRQGNQLQVTNPTPYYVSFSHVSVGNKDIPDAGMVAPKSTLSWPLPVGATGQVTWAAINDYGGTSTQATAQL